MKNVLLALCVLSYQLVRLLLTPVCVAMKVLSVFRKGDSILWNDDGLPKKGNIEHMPYNEDSVYAGVRFSECSPIKWIPRHELWRDNALNRFLLGY